MLTRCALEVAPHKSLKKRIMICAQSILFFYAMTGNVSFASGQRNSMVDACRCMGTSDALPQPHNLASTPAGLTHVQVLFSFPAEAVNTLQEWLVEEGLRAKLDN
jgi:hypothetical protein